MKKIALTIACMAIFILPAASMEPGKRPVLGVEWAFGLTFHTFHTYNYLRADGTRIQGSDHQFITNLNASILFKGGYDLGTRWNISVITGYEGINDRFRIIPLGTRGTYFFGNGQNKDGSFIFIEPGTTLFSSADNWVFYMRLGFGKRFELSPATVFDISLFYRLTHSCPELVDPDQEIVDRLFSNNILTGFLGINMSLNFQYSLFKR